MPGTEVTFPVLTLVTGVKAFPRGYSSAGRAVALQAIGQGFESPYLQLKPRERSGSCRTDNAANGVQLKAFALDTVDKTFFEGL